MILHYSLAILNTNDNALSLLFFANAPMSDVNSPYVQLLTFNHVLRKRDHDKRPAARSAFQSRPFV